MSDSRLEKFIYAICSMDVSDLPVPLSRIEKLWNCLITGETPDFEPLSRNEKYLMAMLDRYDISNLPAPMSRGEKLLYKIAVGETDLSDVPGYLSRYEELLKYLIENGGISGGDFEYVLYAINQSLYTLYTTAEKPVKSAILKGQTLVNILPSVNDDRFLIRNSTTLERLEDGFLRINAPHNGRWEIMTNTIPIKPSTKYLLITEVKNNTLDGMITLANVTGFTTNNLTKVSVGFNGVLKQIIATKDVLSDYIFQGWLDSGSNGFADIRNTLIEYQEGMENWDIPYFEGMQSVKMPVLKTTGKNLLNPNWQLNTWYPFKLKSGTKLTLSTKDSVLSKGGNIRLKATDETDVWMGINEGTTKKTITLQKDVYKLSNMLNGNIEYQLEIGDNTPYEPFKSNILSASEDVTLRGIGDVKDELNLLTGEAVERIGEIVLNEDITGYKDTNYSTNEYSAFRITSIANIPNGLRNVICDKVKYYPNFGLDWTKQEEFFTFKGNLLFIKILSTKASNFEELRTFLSSSPITIQYEIAESIKTVDLTVVDQNNQPTQLGTFENVTHVSLESAGLIPEVEMEVATNLLEDTVFNLTDAFNTLYPTAAKPVKSAILKGQTLVNLFDFKEPITVMTDRVRLFSSDNFKNNLLNGTYTIINTSNKKFALDINDKSTDDWKKTVTLLGGQKTTLVFDNTYIRIASFAFSDGWSKDNLEEIKRSLVVLNGEHTDIDIPYFEGMQSVKMPVLTTTGKNLFDKTKIIFNKLIDWNTGIISDNSSTNTTDFIKVIPNTQYTMSFNFTTSAWTRCVGFTEPKQGKYATDVNGKSDKCYFDSDSKTITFTTSPTTKYLLFSFGKGVEESFQIEQGSTATSYEPYKSITLSTPSDLELRKVGDVQDEVNVMTGEVIQRIKSKILKGEVNNEDWRLFRNNVIEKIETVDFYLINNEQKTNTEIKCDTFKVQSIKSAYQLDEEGISGKGGSGLNVWLSISKTKATNVAELRSYLKTNPITIQYELATPTTKTVDLSVINQDGNETKLRTFDDTTHVLLNSEGLIPTASLTVRTKIPSASSTSLLMDDISNEQQQLETTVDEQSNNVDATMIATTEIYEETL